MTEKKFIKLNMIQAFRGDCFLLEYGKENKTTNEKDTNFILIDGGWNHVYEQNLKPTLVEKVQKEKKPLELIISTHIDEDHIKGLVMFFADCINNGKFIEFNQLWFNSFGESIRIERKDIELEIKEILAILEDLENEEEATRSVAQGVYLNQYANNLDVILNHDFIGNKVTLENSKKIYDFKGLNIKVIGPRDKYLKKLKKLWLNWLDTNKDLVVAMASDEERRKRINEALISVPNLSSIIILAEFNNRKFLFTGDATSDQVEAGLKDHNLSDKDGIFKVDVLKIPHHGSDHNVTDDFFNRIQADIYLISGDGFKGNPEFSTLGKIVFSEYNKKRKTPIKLYVTNRTQNIIDFTTKYPGEKNNYIIEFLGKKKYLEIVVD